MRATTMARKPTDHTSRPEDKGLPNHTWELVTPDMARSWLGVNFNNRNLNAKRVDTYARLMTEGDWEANGEAIKFGDDGTLYDGQHRLSACVQADVPFYTSVIRGVAHEARATLDIGASRTLGNVLSIAGHKNVNMLASGYRLLYQIKHDITLTRTGGLSPHAVGRFAERHTTLARHMLMPGTMPQGLPTQMIGVISYLLAEVMQEPESAAAWMNTWKTGRVAYPGDPVQALRERFLRDKMTNTGGGKYGNKKRKPINEQWWNMSHAVNKYRAHEPMTRWKWMDTPVYIDGLDRSAL